MSKYFVTADLETIFNTNFVGTSQSTFTI